MRLLILPALALAASASYAEPAQKAVSIEQTLLRSEWVAERVSVKPGSQLAVGIRQHLAPGWHTYWRNPGNIGQATRVTWSLPAGWQAGEVQWPTPNVYRTGGMVSFVYSDGVLLPLTITVSPQAPKGFAHLVGEVSSLLCKDVCIPVREAVSLDLEVSDVAGAATADADAIEQAMKRIATRGKLNALFDSNGQKLTLALPGLRIEQGAAFYPLEGQGVNSDAMTALRVADQGVALTIGMQRNSPVPHQLRGVVSVGANGPDFEVNAVAGELPHWALAEPGAADNTGWLRLAMFVLLGVGGGLLLNAMPCVFPILAGKAAALAGAGTDRRALRREAAAYCLGAIAAFVGLAAALLSLRGIGQSMGWGFQLQSPLFVAVLALLMLGCALNLAGMFDAGLWLQRRAGDVRISSNEVGAFVTGALAAAVAAPCTAPLMAPAIGWALTQPAPAALTVFGSIGLGLAGPFLALAWVPGASRWLPRPGPWLSRLRQILAFPMLAGAAWLCWVFVVLRGVQGLPGLLAALIGLAFALWCWGMAQRNTHGLGWRVAGIVAAAAWVPAGLVASTSGFGSAAEASAEYQGESWSEERVEQALAQGHPVLVNVTAAWCITCQVNESVALSSEAVRRVVERTGTKVFKADWTRPDEKIERLLAIHGRSGVPFYFVRTLGRRDIELPQILTPKTVTDALAAATQVQLGSQSLQP